YRGDGIMALFGAPIAHEDHALPACYAALHLEDELPRYAEELKRRRGVSFSGRMAPAARGGTGLVAACGHGPLRVTLVPAQHFFRILIRQSLHSRATTLHRTVGRSVASVST